MEDFFLKNYLLLTHSVEIIAASVSLLLLKKYKFTEAKLFSYFLVCVVLFDFLGGYTWYIRGNKFLSFLKGTIIEKNYWWTTTYWSVGAILFFGFYYHKVLSNRKFKKIIKIASITFLAFSIFYIACNFQDFFNKFFPVINVTGAIIIFMCSVFYFLEILLSDKILHFYKDLNFYISATIFIWWLIITPIVFYDIYTTYEIDVFSDVKYRKLRYLIYLFANIFMYSTFTFALIFCKPENKTQPV